MSCAFVILRSSGQRLECTADHPNLLTTLEAHNLCIEFQCREGYCGLCRTRLIKGEVHYTEKPLAFLQKGEILPCCCLVTEEIEIEL
ncbi:class I ribonucleotide reductase maintenance protein YfaE [Pantoea sp. Nvir]|uniref:class I ribonucleotide reductase maintenance protein YfaE n=1 Tax=Pantoea sp. Nvir TaxID=2576760 RepID=UPI001358E30F|nr:class I ribonucleotide reductase maintenance protein YfaE [Pantoea sp. Nvir]MXP66621.1 2Fe-2S ferredoxin-like protein [Pantoea sp. Nvir]CAJ0992041.1 hypothetical protein NVIRPANT_00504 [Pantoea sp. Nvir]